jgi:hypothetical protein
LLILKASQIQLADFESQPEQLADFESWPEPTSRF